MNLLPAPPVQRIYYAFDSRGLPKPLVQQHADFARTALSRRFDISPENVKVVPRSAASDDFQLTCYGSKSTTCPAAMVHAVRVVAPHMKKLEADFRHSRDQLDGWSPGTCASADKAVLEGLVSGEISWCEPKLDATLRAHATAALALPDDITDGLFATMPLARVAQAMLWLQKARNNRYAPRPA
jgi:hypothetical protein